MGKTKHNKRKNRHKPTGLVSVQEAGEQSKETDGELGAKTLPILEKLNCLVDRRHACAGLANLVLEPNAVLPLMKHDIVRRVAPLILDSDETIQEAATGVLRNLTIGGGPEACQLMVEQDIMTPVTHYIKKFSEGFLDTAESSDMVKQQANVHEQVIHLLLNLCENASETIKAVNEQCIVPILVSFLNPDLLPLSNIIVTAQCLCTITEDNPSASEALVHSKNSLPLLEKILLCDGGNEELLLLKVITAGSLFNIGRSLPSHCVFEMFQVISNIFSKVLDYDIGQYVQQLNEKMKCQDVPQTERTDLENDKCENKNVVNLAENEVQKFHQLLEAQKITLEILTNMCCTDESADQDWEDVVSDDHSSSDDMQEDRNGEVDIDQISSRLSEEILTSVVSHGLPNKVLQKCSFTKLHDDSVVMSTKIGPSCVKIIGTIQTRALVCLNNMLSTIDIDHLGGAEAVKLLWSKIMDIAFQNNGGLTSGFARSDDEFVEAASCALRSVLEKLTEAGCQCITTEQVDLLCYLCKVIQSEAARVNFMNVLGIVGKMTIASLSDAVQPLQCIGTVLRDVVTSEESLWVIAEALDAIFDVFADSPVADIAANNIGLLPKLEKTVTTLRTRIKKERRTLGDRIPIVDTARTNLVRFIKYKKQQSQ